MIEQFTVGKLVGEGLNGHIYKAKTLTGIPCVLKYVNLNFCLKNNKEFNAINEIKANMLLNHPNITTMYDFFVIPERDILVLVLEYCEQGDLVDYTDELSEQFTNLVSAKIIMQLVQGIKHMHLNGIIHRDIKPDNILITKDGTAKICDFGLVKLDHEVGKMKHKNFLGTVPYMSQEMVKREAYDERIDFWGIGIITSIVTLWLNPFCSLEEQTSQNT